MTRTAEGSTREKRPITMAELLLPLEKLTNDSAEIVKKDASVDNVNQV